jgi:hypothetical protein
MSDQEKRLEKLRKLLNLAESKGNEAEAMAAIGKAREFAEKYGLSLEDAQAQAASGDTEGFRAETRKSGVGAWCDADNYMSKHISRYCDCIVGNVRQSAGDVWSLEYVGDAVDVELAMWLRGTINRAMFYEWEAYRDFVWKYDKARKSEAAACETFKTAMALRLAERMKDAKAPVLAAETGKALIIAKKDIILNFMRERGIQAAQYGKRAASAYDAKAASYGRAAGDKVPLGRGVSGGPKRLAVR